MLPPVRCFTCNKILDWKTYDEKCESGEIAISLILDEMGVTRYCCRRMHLCHPKELSSRICRFQSQDFKSEKYNFEMLMSVKNDRTIATD